jgi:hypothetical protein
MGMDIQKALKLLDLAPGAALEDARAAFKKKAKQFHPDKLMAASKAGDDGEKMKDINVAYQMLKTVLKPASSTQKSRCCPNGCLLSAGAWWTRSENGCLTGLAFRAGPPHRAIPQPRTPPQRPTGTRGPLPLRRLRMCSNNP